jgi:hypothetical protein
MVAATLPQKESSLSSRTLLLIGVLLSLNLRAQTVPIAGSHGEYGFLILHSQDIAPIGPANPYGLGVDMSWRLDPQKHFSNCNCFPRLGVSLNYHNMDKPEVLGVSVPLYGFLEPHYRLGDNTFLFLRAGMGFTYQNLPFDEVSNPLNLSYSRKLNTFVGLGLGTEYRWDKYWGARIAFWYNHSSNGGAQEPNKGLNYPSIMLGVNRSLEPLDFPSRNQLNNTRKEPLRQIDFQLYMAGKAIDETRVTYAVYGVETSYLQQFNRISAWTVGLEATQNDAYAEVIEQNNLDQSAFEFNFLAGHSFVLGKFTFSQRAGVYLWRDYSKTPDWFQRYGVNYYIWRGFSLGANIRVHGHIAEFLDARIGYSF